MPSVFSTIIPTFFPPLCVHCGAEGAWLCSHSLTILHNEPVIHNPLDIAGVDQVVARGSYDCLPLQNIVTKLKYHYWSGLREGLPILLEPIGALEADAIVPVPLHPRRQRERGFNQADLVSRALAMIMNRPIVQILARQRYTTPQALLTAHQRRQNILGAFASSSRRASIPRSVVLVDDVITTGSTIAECAVALRRRGVQSITALALAKG